ncbi:hypothetical protein CDCA_CDCA07G2222 [Cyanidium caldarium]|uniref:SAGA-associated factor 11 n=1 Tax=Cyanidium caldarium TaxID=2771 RepID=A0AAV9IVB0_CYACA|nr:hypothetical protein CDCA_CDCA07G2222 [Cyanidium caldarium]
MAPRRKTRRSGRRGRPPASREPTEAVEVGFHGPDAASDSDENSEDKNEVLAEQPAEEERAPPPLPVRRRGRPPRAGGPATRDRPLLHADELQQHRNGRREDHPDEPVGESMVDEEAVKGKLTDILARLDEEGHGARVDPTPSMSARLHLTLGVYGELLDAAMQEACREAHREEIVRGCMQDTVWERPRGCALRDMAPAPMAATENKPSAGRGGAREVVLTCSHCNSSVAVSRYAPHLERCVGKGGRQSSRAATVRLRNHAQSNGPLQRVDEGGEAREGDWRMPDSNGDREAAEEEETSSAASDNDGDFEETPRPSNVTKRTRTAAVPLRKSNRPAR